MRGADQDDDSGASTDLTQVESHGANMAVIAEESEPEYPSFNQKKKGDPRRAEDAEFDKVIDSVLADNRSKSPMRRDDLSDDDDDDL